MHTHCCQKAEREWNRVQALQVYLASSVLVEAAVQRTKAFHKLGNVANHCTMQEWLVCFRDT